MEERLAGAFIALGTFDGLHTGHKAVITSEKTEYQRKIALMFTQHPQLSLKGEAPGALITPEKEKEILAGWGVTAEYIDFSDVCDLTPEVFVDDVLIKKYNASSVACGFNYRFGKDASGDVKTLLRLCAEREIKATVAQPVEYDGEAVSSTRIRQALREGRMKDVKNMLGRYFSYDFEVVHGDERGRVIGSPTINQFFDENFAVPQFGVYASFTVVDGKTYPSVTNIGVRPTFRNSEKRSETNIVGFKGDLYGKHPEVFIVEKIREEKKFSSLDDLKNQIEKDRESALAILKGEAIYGI